MLQLRINSQLFFTFRRFSNRATKRGVIVEVAVKCCVDETGDSYIMMSLHLHCRHLSLAFVYAAVVTALLCEFSCESATYGGIGNRAGRRRHSQPFQYYSRNRLSNAVRPIGSSDLDAGYSRLTPRVTTVRHFPRRRLIYRVTKPIAVKRVLRYRSGKLVREEVVDRPPYHHTTTNYRRHYSAPGHPPSLRTDANRHLASGTVLNQPSRLLGSARYPTGNLKQDRWHTNSVGLESDHESSNVLGTDGKARYRSSGVAQNLLINRNRFDHQPPMQRNNVVSSVADREAAMLAKLQPPPGLRFVLVNRNNNQRISSISSSSSSSSSSFPSEVTARRPLIRRRSRFPYSRTTSLQSPNSRVLRIRAKSMTEAQTLLRHIGPGFKVTVINETSAEEPSTTAAFTTSVPATTESSTPNETTNVPDKSLKKWWKRKHVCIRESPGVYGVSDEFRRRIEVTKSCSEHAKQYVCVEKYGFGNNSPTKTTKYHCCRGYRLSANRENCRPRRHKTSRPRNPSIVQRMSDVSNLMTRSSDMESLTIFMPSSDDVVRAAFVSESGASAGTGLVVRNFLENHVIPGRKLLSAQMKNNQVFTAVSGNPIRVNFYPSDLGTVMTANCKRVINRDVINDNTVIHFIGEFIQRVQGTIYDYLQERSQNFSSILSVLEGANMTSALRKSNSSYTLLAPTNAAFDLLSSRIGDNACADALARNHVINEVVCSTGAEERAKNFTTLQMERKAMRQVSSNLYVDQARVLTRDVMTTNGVVHVIDKVLTTSTGAKSVLDVLESRKDLTLALEMFRAVDMTQALVTQNNFTLIVPNNRALKKFSKRAIVRSRRNREKLRSILMFHLIPVQIDNFPSNQLVETLHPPYVIHVTDYLMNKRERNAVGRWRYVRKPATSLQCARIISNPEHKPCNGAIFVTNKVLKPPRGTITTTLMESRKSNFTTLLRAVRRTAFARILDGDQVITMFAPSEVAFSRIPRWVIDRLLRNKHMLTRVLKYHIITGFHCAHELLQRSQRRQTLLGATVLTCPKRRKIYLGRKRRRLRAKVLEKNIVATNGVIHAIDNLLLPPNFKLLR